MAIVKVNRLPAPRVSDIFKDETESCAALVGKGVSEYIRYAIEEMNKKVRKEMKK